MDKKSCPACNFGAASVVLAVLAIIGCWMPIWSFVAVILAVLAVAFAMITIVKAEGKGVAIVGLIIAVIACVGGVAQSINYINALADRIADLETTVDDMDGTNSAELEEYVEVGQIIGDEMSGNGVPVIVTNNSDATASFIVTVEMFDKGGVSQGLEYVFTDEIKAGGEYNDIVFEMTDDEMAANEGATFEVNEVRMFATQEEE